MDDLNFVQCQAFSVKSVVYCVQNRCLYEAVICPVHRLHVLKTTKPGNNTAIYYIRNVHNRFKSLNTQQLQTERKKKT